MARDGLSNEAFMEIIARWNDQGRNAMEGILDDLGVSEEQKQRGLEMYDRRMSERNAEIEAEFGSGPASS